MNKVLTLNTSIIKAASKNLHTIILSLSKSSIKLADEMSKTVGA